MRSRQRRNGGRGTALHEQQCGGREGLAEAFSQGPAIPVRGGERCPFFPGAWDTCERRGAMPSPSPSPWPGGPLSADRGFGSGWGGPHFHPKVTGAALRLLASYNRVQQSTAQARPRAGAAAGLDHLALHGGRQANSDGRRGPGISQPRRRTLWPRSLCLPQSQNKPQAPLTLGPGMSPPSQA